MFERTRSMSASVIRDGTSIGQVQVEAFPLDTKAKLYGYMNGVDVSFQAYVSKDIPIRTFDLLNLDTGDTYKIAQVTEYSTFYYVIGEKMHHER